MPPGANSFPSLRNGELPTEDSLKSVVKDCLLEKRAEVRLVFFKKRVAGERHMAANRLDDHEIINDVKSVQRKCARPLRCSG